MIGKNPMRKQSYSQKNSRVLFYAVLLIILLGIGFIVTRDINVPTERVSQDVKVTLEH